MQALDASALLRCWEEGRNSAPPLRAIAMLACAGGDEESELAALPLGARHRRLLELYAASFGDAAELTLVCPSCEARSTTTVPTRGSFAAPEAREIALTTGGRTLRLRPVTTADLLALDPALPHEVRVRQLLSACVRGEDGGPLATGDLSVVEEEVSERLGDCDPLAEIQLQATCADCGASFVSELDVVDLCWSAVRSEASRITQDVAEIARAFGWSEREILSMSPARRGTWLELARA